MIRSPEVYDEVRADGSDHRGLPHLPLHAGDHLHTRDLREHGTPDEPDQQHEHGDLQPDDTNISRGTDFTMGRSVHDCSVHVHRVIPMAEETVKRHTLLLIF